MLELISLAAAAGAGIAGYVTSKDFTLRKLRFVDAAHRPAARPPCWRRRWCGSCLWSGRAPPSSWARAWRSG